MSPGSVFIISVARLYQLHQDVSCYCISPIVCMYNVPTIMIFTMMDDSTPRSSFTLARRPTALSAYYLFNVFFRVSVKGGNVVIQCSLVRITKWWNTELVCYKDYQKLLFSVTKRKLDSVVIITSNALLHNYNNALCNTICI